MIKKQIEAAQHHSHLEHEHQPNCLFCLLGKQGINQEFQRLYSVDQSVPIAVNRSHMAILDAFPITEGHMMLLPKSHSTSSAEVPRQDHFRQDTGKLLQHLRQHYPEAPLIMFEHGSGMNDGKKTVMCGNLCNPGNDHTHVHMLPAINPVSGTSVDCSFETIDGAVNDWLQIAGWGTMETGSNVFYSPEIYGSRPPRMIQGRPYITIGVLNPQNTYFEATYLQTQANQKVPSQLLRRSLSKILRGRHSPSTEWDYQELGGRIFLDGITSEIPFLQQNVFSYIQRTAHRTR